MRVAGGVGGKSARSKPLLPGVVRLGWTSVAGRAHCVATGRSTTPSRHCPRTHRRGPSIHANRCATAHERTFGTETDYPCPSERSSRPVSAAHGVIQGRDSERGRHPRVDRVAHNPVGVHVSDGAKVELALIGLGSSRRRNTSRRWSLRTNSTTVPSDTLRSLPDRRIRYAANSSRPSVLRCLLVSAPSSIPNANDARECSVGSARLMISRWCRNARADASDPQWCTIFDDSGRTLRSRRTWFPGSRRFLRCRPRGRTQNV